MSRVIDRLLELKEEDLAGEEEYSQLCKLFYSGQLSEERLSLLVEERGFYFYRVRGKKVFRELMSFFGRGGKAYGSIGESFDRFRVLKTLSSDLTHRLIDVEQGYRHTAYFTYEVCEVLDYLMPLEGNLFYEGVGEVRRFYKSEYFDVLSL